MQQLEMFDMCATSNYFLLSVFVYSVYPNKSTGGKLIQYQPDVSKNIEEPAKNWTQIKKHIETQPKQDSEK